MADEESQLLTGEKEGASIQRTNSAGDAPEEGVDLDPRKYTMSDIWAVLKEMHRLKGGDTSTGTLTEAFARGVVNAGEKAYNASQMGSSVYVIALLLAITMLLVSVGLDVYLSMLGVRYYGNVKCAVPLETWALVMGLLGLALVPISAVNKLTIEATSADKRASYNGALASLVFLVPMVQIVWFLVGASWVYQINSSGVNDTPDTQCEPDLYYFVYYYILAITIFFAVLVWLSLMACVGMCLGTRICLDLLPDSIRNVRQNIEAQKNGRKGE